MQISGINPRTGAVDQMRGWGAPAPAARRVQSTDPRIHRMPLKRTVQKARKAKRAGKAPSTQAGAFIHEEIDKVRKGAHGARSAKQAIAIGLSKARRAGVKLPPPGKGTVPEETREKAQRDLEKGQEGGMKTPRLTIPPRRAPVRLEPSPSRKRSQT